MVSETVKQCRCHLGITEDRRPFAEGQIGGDDDGCAFVELADEMEQELSTGLCKGQIAKFIEQHKIKAGHVISNAALIADTRLAFQSIDQIDHIEEPASQVSPDIGARNGDGQMVLPVPVPPISTALR